jgi:hypothetical protein
MRTPTSLAALCLLVLALAPAAELRAQPQIQAANITANEGNAGSTDAVLTVTLSSPVNATIARAVGTATIR